MKELVGTRLLRLARKINSVEIEKVGFSLFRIKIP